MARFLLKIICPVVLISCIQERPGNKKPDESSEDAVVEKFLASYYDDMSARDWQKYRTYFWDDATITTAWQKPGDSAVRVHVITIDEFIEETPRGPDSQPVFREQMKSASIEIKHDLATAWVEYNAEFGKPDSLMKWSGIDVFSFLKNDGEWRITSLVFSNN
ncbi:MAG: nuclear transport factor 2 family protein [Cyclobacteriaceae bacterium]